MPNTKEETSKKTVYKDTVPNSGTPYKAPEVHEDLFSMRTTVAQRDGFRTYWARESEVRLRLMEGYEVADSVNYPQLGQAFFQDPNKKDTSVMRLPSQDSNEDLILMEISLEKYEMKKAKEAAVADFREAQIKGKVSTNPAHGVTMEKEGKHSIEN